MKVNNGAMGRALILPRHLLIVEFMAEFQPTTPQVTRFIDPQALTRIASLELIARAVVEGFISGLHRSPHLGFSVNFAEYRTYRPGDDIRKIDWKVYGRTDRFFVKEYEGETNTGIHLILDCSRSMDYANEGIRKLEYGQFLAASLGYFAFKQRDAVGFISGPAFKQGAAYPYRSMLPKRIDNLLAAGRCGSATFIGHGAGKSMGNMIELGQAAGVAAGIAALDGVKARDVDVGKVKAFLSEVLKAKKSLPLKD